MNADRIKAILADEDFLAIVGQTRQMLTKRVMAKSTDDDLRAIALAEYHAIDSLLNQMRSEAQNSKDKPHE